MEAIAKFEELIETWEDDHPLTEQAEEFSKYLEGAMEKLVETSTAKK